MDSAIHPLNNWGLASPVHLFYCRLVRDPRANYQQSLEVLRHVKRIQPNMVTKSSLMLGLGEKDEEVLQALKGASNHS